MSFVVDRDYGDTNPDSFDGVAWALQESWAGIFVAAVAFSVLYLFGILIWAVGSGAISIVGFLLSLILLVVFPMIGMLVTGFWSIFAFIFVLVLNLTLWESLNRRIGVAIFGGATGFLGTYWQIFDWASVSTGWAVFRLVGVALAVLFGQFGALIWGRRKNVFYDAETLRSSADAEEDAPRYQFGIKQMLAVTVLFGLVFAADRFFPRHEVLVMVGVYAVLQVIGLGLDWVLLFLRSRRQVVVPQ